LAVHKIEAEVITFKALNHPRLLTIRYASESDIPLIRDLCFRVWPQTYSSLLSQAQIDYMLGLMYSEASLKKQMEEEHRFLLLSDDDIPIGFASYSEIEPRVWKLHKLYVLSSYQGKGGGRELVDFVLKDVANEGGLALQLNVNRNNKAKLFYDRLGFKVIREEDIDIGNGYFMNDYIMEIRVSS
jgi:diamine N-acetyltransferase